MRPAKADTFHRPTPNNGCPAHPCTHPPVLPGNHATLTATSPSVHIVQVYTLYTRRMLYDYFTKGQREPTCQHLHCTCMHIRGHSCVHVIIIIQYFPFPSLPSPPPRLPTWLRTVRTVPSVTVSSPFSVSPSKSYNIRACRVQTIVMYISCTVHVYKLHVYMCTYMYDYLQVYLVYVTMVMTLLYNYIDVYIYTCTCNTGSIKALVLQLHAYAVPFLIAAPPVPKLSALYNIRPRYFCAI